MRPNLSSQQKNWKKIYLAQRNKQWRNKFSQLVSIYRWPSQFQLERIISFCRNVALLLENRFIYSKQKHRMFTLIIPNNNKLLGKIMEWFTDDRMKTRRSWNIGYGKNSSHPVCFYHTFLTDKKPYKAVVQVMLVLVYRRASKFFFTVLFHFPVRRCVLNNGKTGSQPAVKFDHSDAIVLTKMIPRSNIVWVLLITCVTASPASQRHNPKSDVESVPGEFYFTVIEW